MANIFGLHNYSCKTTPHHKVDARTCEVGKGGRRKIKIFALISFSRETIKLLGGSFPVPPFKFNFEKSF